MHTKIILSFLLSVIAVSPVVFASDAALEKTIQSDLKKRYEDIQKSNSYEEKMTKFKNLMNYINGEHKKYSDSVYDLTSVVNQPDGADKTRFIEWRATEQIYLDKWSAVQTAFELPSRFFANDPQYNYLNCGIIESEILNLYKPGAMTRFSIDLSIKITRDLCLHKPSR